MWSRLRMGDPRGIASPREAKKLRMRKFIHVFRKIREWRPDTESPKKEIIELIEAIMIVTA